MARNPIDGAQRETELEGSVIGRDEGGQCQRARNKLHAGHSSSVSCPAPTPATTHARTRTLPGPRSCFLPEVALAIWTDGREWSCRRRPGMGGHSCSPQPQWPAPRWAATTLPLKVEKRRWHDLTGVAEVDNIGQLLLCFRHPPVPGAVDWAVWVAKGVVEQKSDISFLVTLMNEVHSALRLSTAFHSGDHSPSLTVEHGLEGWIS